MGGRPGILNVPSLNKPIDKGKKVQFVEKEQSEIRSCAKDVSVKSEDDNWAIITGITEYLQCIKSSSSNMVKKEIHEMWKSPICQISPQICKVPLIDVLIDGKTFPALVDTGAGTCVMDKRVADSLKLKSTISKIHVASCNGAPLQVIGEVRAEIDIAGRKQWQRFVIVDQLAHQIILGTDLIISMAIIPLLHECSFCFGSDLKTKYRFNQKCLMADTVVSVVMTTDDDENTERKTDTRLDDSKTIIDTEEQINAHHNSLLIVVGEESGSGAKDDSSSKGDWAWDATEIENDSLAKDNSSLENDSLAKDNSSLENDSLAKDNSSLENDSLAKIHYSKAIH